MGLDGIAVKMAGPLGLAMLAIFVAAPIAIWRGTIARWYPNYGAWLLFGANLAGLGGLAVYSFVSSYLDFSGRVRPSGLQETQRWAIVPGWSIALFLMFLLGVLPVFGLLLTPISAAMVAIRASRKAIAFTVLFLAWVGLFSLDLKRSPEPLFWSLWQSLWVVVAIPAPFLLVFLFSDRGRCLSQAGRKALRWALS